MPVTRRAFPCGHRGHGKTCHRCEDADRLLARSNGNPEDEYQVRLLRMTDRDARAERERVRKEAAERAARELARLQRIDDVNLGRA